MVGEIDNFVDTIRNSKVEVYNEFSLQHELGIFLRSRLVNLEIQFERNVSLFFITGEFVKKEIDISVYAADKSRLHCAIELKFPRNGQYPEQMFSFCKDIKFAEQLKRSGFEQTFFLVFADDPLFYSGNHEGIYSYFRRQETVEAFADLLLYRPGADDGVGLRVLLCSNTPNAVSGLRSARSGGLFHGSGSS